jgi:hypothetical protein
MTFLVANTASGRIVSHLETKDLFDVHGEQIVFESKVDDTDLEIVDCGEGFHDTGQSGVYTHWYDNENRCTHPKTDMQLEYSHLAIQRGFFDTFQYNENIASPGIQMVDPADQEANGDPVYDVDINIYSDIDVIYAPAESVVRIANIPTDPDTFINIHRPNGKENTVIDQPLEFLDIIALGGEVINVGIDSPKYFLKGIDIVGEVI